MVLVATGDQTELTKPVEVSTTTLKPFAQVISNPNRLLCTPKLELLVSTCGVHNAVGTPAKFVPQPVVPGK